MTRRRRIWIPGKRLPGSWTQAGKSDCSSPLHHRLRQAAGHSREERLEGRDTEGCRLVVEVVSAAAALESRRIGER